MSQTLRDKSSKARNDADFKKSRAINARPLPSGTFKELSGVVKVGKQELELSEDTKGFMNAWPKGAIVELTNITRGLKWKK